jgi:hypothetical protein
MKALEDLRTLNRLETEIDEIQAGVDKVFAERRAEYELLWGEPMKEERQ